MQASEADGSSVINRSSISGFWTNDGSTLSTKEHSVDKSRRLRRGGCGLLLSGSDVSFEQVR